MEWKVKCPACGHEFVIRFPTYDLNTMVIENRLAHIDPCYKCKQDEAGFILLEILKAPGCVKA